MGIEDWCNSSNDRQNHLFFGERSELALRLLRGKKDPADATELLKTLHELEESKGRGRLIFADTNRGELKARLKGLHSFLLGYSKWLADTRMVSPDVIGLLCESVNHFNLAWPASPASRDVWSPSGLSNEKQGTVTELCHRLREELAKQSVRSEQSRGFYIVHDLIYDFSEQVSPFNQVSLPVLLYSEEGQLTQGKVAWLTIQLVRDGGIGFAPDPLPLGLTSIAYGSEDEKLIHSMDRIWQLSQLEKQGFRGRWKLEGKCPIEGHLAEWKSDSGDKAFHIPHVYGRSMETAAMVGLLAASGRIQFQECVLEGSVCGTTKLDDRSDSSTKVFIEYQPLSLNHQVAVTSVVEPVSIGNDILDLRLAKVGGIDAKLAAARKYRLAENDDKTLIDTVLLSKEQSDQSSTEISQIKTAKTEKDRSSKQYEGINLQFVETIGEALDWMLEVNVAKKLYMDACLEDWEKEWGYAKDEQGWFINWDGKPFVDSQWILDNDGNWIDQDGELKVTADDWIKNRVNTGSLKFMQNPVGGASGTDTEFGRNNITDKSVLSSEN